MSIRYYIGVILLGWMVGSTPLAGQSIERTVEERLKNFFESYSTNYARIGKTNLESFKLDNSKRTLDVYAGTSFGNQPFTQEMADGIYRTLKQSLPGPVNYYNITIYADGKPIEELIPNALLARNKRDKSRLWNNIRYTERAWVTNDSRPYKISHGLEGRHLAVWQSHGKYFKNERGQWVWQRPRLFCTTEDLFTQSFVVPFIIPMLENAGAIVFTPRERDPQRNEVIVDNDYNQRANIYYEEKSKKSPWNNSSLRGFAHTRNIYSDGEAPFVTGTARFAPTAGRKKKTKTLATWIPDIPETGHYAVYVSYQTLPGAINDAHYTVFHKGGATEFSVNQQIGSGTWVYLGTFEFDKGHHDYGFVALSNESKQKGIVSADAVRFGGGMGNIVRNGSVSGMPRYLEGARYWAQWAGMPYSVYGGRKGENDYADDINTRSLMSNHLSGGSVYNPSQKGLGVPLEMTMGVHSDAGFSKSDDKIGTLGIYTTDFNEGKLSSGLCRYTSRDLTDLVLTDLSRDLSSYLGTPWARRAMWNRNYSESRLPAVPSTILEILSHQNFADMKLGHDPNFKFALSRSVYKSILKYTAVQHGEDYVVQPLPVNNFAIRFTSQPKPVKKRGKKQDNATVELSWTPVSDPLEPTAKPREYIVYTRIGYGGFDNGTLVRGTSCTKELEPGLVYSFKITAVNQGGESFPSEILSAYQAPESNTTLLIINGFDRLSAPATIETTNLQGFDLRRDPGVPYIYNTSYCGTQIGFDRKQIGKETSDGLGYSSSELEGMRIAGNTFDYPFIHGKAIQATGDYSFVSCSDEAVENGYIRLKNYPAIDLILGLEKRGGYSAMNREVYQTFSPAMQQALNDYCRQGGRIFASGSYIGSDMSTSPADRNFITQLLKYQSGNSLAPLDIAGSRESVFTSTIRGANLTLTIPRTLNEESYSVPMPESLIPVQPAFAAFVYEERNVCAGIAYDGADYKTFILGFPFESIRGEQQRAQTMAAIMKFLLK